VDRLPELIGQPSTAELQVVMLAALATLPPQARAVVVLRYREDLSIDQVAIVMRCSTGNVKSQSARALQKLRKALGGGTGVGGRLESRVCDSTIAMTSGAGIRPLLARGVTPS
jgi:hypothetical protein